MKRLSSILIVLIALAVVHVFGQGTPMPSPFFLAQDNNGLIIAAAKLCTYAAGTTTPLATYSDVGLLVANTNPVVTDSAGRATVYLSQTSYKFTLYTGGTAATCDGTQVWSKDNISAIPSASGNVDNANAVAGENLTAGQVTYLSDGSGGKNAGQWYRADAGNTYSSTLPEIGIATAAIAAGATGTVRLLGRSTNLSGLTIGLEYFVGSTGALTATKPANLRHVGHADGATSLVVTSDPPPFLLSPNGLPTLTAADGQVLIGRASDHTLQLGQLTAGAGLMVINTSGGITISTGTFAHSSTTAANPSGTANTGGLMMGLAGSITPTGTGTILFCLAGNLSTNTDTDGAAAQLRFGTGAAPANGGALIGTAIGSSQRISGVTANNIFPVGGCVIRTGLTVNTTAWFDISLAAVTGGTATATSVVLTAVEVP